MRRDIRHGARHRADGVVGHAHGRDAADRDAPMAGRRPATPVIEAGIRTEPPVSVPSAASAISAANHGAGAAAGPPRNALRVPRVSALADHRIGRDDAPCQLLHVGLADQHGALRLESPDHGSVAVGDMVRKVGGAAGGAHACRLDIVFEGDGHAVEEAEPAPPGRRPVAGIGLLPRPLRRGGDHRVKRGIELLDPREATLDRRPRGAGRRGRCGRPWLMFRPRS